MDVTNIAAKDLDVAYTVTVSSGAGTIWTIQASVLTYAYAVLSSNATNIDSLKDVARALYLYNEAANDYFSQS